MSPVGGVGINYAIQDAVVTANVLVKPLRAGAVTVSALAAVQLQRAWPTRIIQLLQAQAQKRVLMSLLHTTGPLRVPRWFRAIFRLPGARTLGPQLIGIGFRPAHVAPELRAAREPAIEARPV
jgi:2-polyprenyl-6-methoxyphenol hydroxylase-like FAD-dependent oxidoreductase